MCGRSSLAKTEKEIQTYFGIDFYEDDIARYNPLPNYNVAPTHKMPVVTNKDPDHFLPLSWGLIPFWAKDQKIGYKMINARSETILEKNAFKQAAQKRRCAIPMDAYYEWVKKDGKKIPYRIYLKSYDLFMVAGLWEKWNNPKGESIYTYTVLTQNAAEPIKHIHDRMPIILQQEHWNQWLDNSISTQTLLENLPLENPKELAHFEVSTALNNVRNNKASLIQPFKNTPPSLFDTE